MADINERRIENVQTLLTIPERQRLEAMAASENKKLSELLRCFILESLAVWEKSAPGRRRRVK